MKRKDVAKNSSHKNVLKSKRRRINKEIKALDHWWNNSLGKITKMNKKSKMLKKKRDGQSKTSKTKLKNEQEIVFKAPFPVINKNSNNIKSSKRNEKTKFSNIKRYILDNKAYFCLSEILHFLKFVFNIDYENFILKDEEKQEFKAKTNEFFKDNTIIYNKTQILIEEEFIELFFKLVAGFIQIEKAELLDRFTELNNNIKEEILQEQLEYLKPTAFVYEYHIKSDELFKKKGGQYLKYKTIPKWHHYAWDMTNQITNSRKSFIFKKFTENDETEHSKKKLDIDTIILQLKLKIYHNIYEFTDDLIKMIRYSTESMQRSNNIKNVSYCKSIENRIHKQIKKLKEENKI